MLAPYLPILILFGLAFAFASFSVGIAPFTEPTPQPLGPNRFPIKYFLTAMLFIVFDIEIIFLYPYAVANRALGLFGLVEIILFIVTVFTAYAYVWRRGGLTWD
jgi:NADH-quinone oxidoreductase subunit A